MRSRHDLLEIDSMLIFLWGLLVVWFYFCNFADVIGWVMPIGNFFC